MTIKSGNPILPDQLEGVNRNDRFETAYNFTADARELVHESRDSFWLATPNRGFFHVVRAAGGDWAQAIGSPVKRGQELALETAKIGVPVGAIDKAVRAFYEGRGWSKDYGLPGTSHRTGHGIGMDGHEPPYLVRSDTTPLEAGMCFSDEPGIYIPGEFGVRMEDCWYMTEAGPKLFTPLAPSIDEPI